MHKSFMVTQTCVPGILLLTKITFKAFGKLLFWFLLLGKKNIFIVASALLVEL